jgi:lipid-binding SYLF domain-containing protein
MDCIKTFKEKKMKTTIIRLMCLSILLSIIGGCSTVPESREAKTVLSAEVQEALVVMKAKDPGIDRFFEKSYGYAVLPKVFKGALLVGGAHGKGEVFEQGKRVGYCSMSQATLGFSFGGEYFREIIFFRDKEDLDRFKQDEYTFSAQVTGVALSAGAAAKADYRAGMAVFITTDTGLMVDASLGGQKFRYVPLPFTE